MLITSKGPLPSGSRSWTCPVRVSGRQVVDTVGAAGALLVRAYLADPLQHLHLDPLALLQAGAKPAHVCCCQPVSATGAAANVDVTVPGARRGDFADASLDTSSITFVLDCHVWSNNSVRVTARNVSASTVSLAVALLSLQVVKRRVP